MRKRNHTVTIRMNKAEYELLQSKVKESGRTQQEVVIKAIADLKIASTEEVEELKVEKKLNMENKEKAVAVSEKMIGMAIAFCVV